MTRSTPITLLLLWWPFWLLVALSPLNRFDPPTIEVSLMFGVASLMFAVGILTVNLIANHRLVIDPHGRSQRFLTACNAIAFLCCLLLFFCLLQSGALTRSQENYWHVARVASIGSSLTGIGALDAVTKVFIYPILYTTLVAALVIYRNKLMIALSVTGSLLFSYLWQVNYPIVYTFFIFVFYFLLENRHTLPRFLFSRRGALLVLIVIFLAFSAAFRYGEFGVAALRKYFLEYQILGFSIFSSYFNDPESLIHQLSFGRSSAGLLDLIFYQVTNIFQLGYSSAVLENVNTMAEPIDIGLLEPLYRNAFGTMLFTFYRDASFSGILIFPFVYGFAAGMCYLQARSSPVSMGLFIVLASSWIIGIMISPIERPYFWFSLLSLTILGYAQRFTLARVRES